MSKISLKKDFKAHISFNMQVLLDNGLRLVLNDSKIAKVIKSPQAHGDVLIPDLIEYKSVTYQITNIDDEAFKENQHITAVLIPPTVKRIGKKAFYYCDILNTVIFMKSEISELREIDDYAFFHCPNLLNFDPIPKTVKRIGKDAFYGCTGLESISFSFDLNAELEIIDNGAFRACMNLKDVGPIPANVKRIGNYAFYACDNLEFIEIIDFIDYPSCLEEIGDKAFSRCSKMAAISPLPKSVKVIGESCFEDAYQLSSIEIQSNNITIKDNCFKGCLSLVRAGFPHSLEVNLGKLAFDGASKNFSLEIQHGTPIGGKGARQEKQFIHDVGTINFAF